MAIRFERGVPSAAAQLVGGGLVVGAEPHSLAWWVGWSLLAFGICLLIWGIRINGKPWWQRSKSKPQLYLYLAPMGTEYDPWKSYFVTWSPTANLGIGFSNRSSVQIAMEKELPPEESGVVLHLFNAGPDDVRHLKVKWSLPDFDVVETVKREELFGSKVARLNATGIELVHEGSGSRRPFRNPEETVFPILRAHKAIPIRSPEGFTSVLAVACLVVANGIRKEMIPMPDATDEASPFEMMEKFERPMPRIAIDLEYTLPDGTVVKQGFDLVARSGLSGFMRKKADEKNTYEPVPDSLAGNIQHLQVISR